VTNQNIHCPNHMVCEVLCDGGMASVASETTMTTAMEAVNNQEAQNGNNNE